MRYWEGAEGQLRKSLKWGGFSDDPQRPVPGSERHVLYEFVLEGMRSVRPQVGHISLV